MNDWWKEEIVYQIYPRSFKDSNNDGIGDINGIISKLDYLKDLGITMIWLCPVYKSPMADNGYDISDYYKINEEFGTMEDFDKLVDECNKRDIKIMMDMVLNHTSDEHPWFKEAIKNPDSKYHDYYIFKKSKERPNNWRSQFGGSAWQKVPYRDEYYLHSFDKKQPDLNWENPNMRKDIYKMVNWWIDKGIKAFRLDVINQLKKDQSFKSIESDGNDGLAKITKVSRNQPGLEVFLKELKDNTFGPNNCMTVGETAGLSDEKLKEFVGDDGYFSMVFDLRHTSLEIETGSKWYLRKDWTFRDFYDTLLNSQYTLKDAGWPTVFLENHDQPRSSSKYLGKYDKNQSALKTLSAFYFFMKGVPYIYQGQELGMRNFNRKSIDEFDDVDSIGQYKKALDNNFSQNESLEIVNLRSRDNTRVPFAWSNSKYVGFSDVKPWLKPAEDNSISNVYEQENIDGILKFNKEMINLRKASPYSEILTYGDIKRVDNKEDRLLVYKRIKDNNEILCVFNFDDKETDYYLEDKKISNKNIILENIKTQIKDGKLKLKPFHSVLISL